MKKYLTILIISFIAISCESDESYENINIDVNQPESVTDNALFSSATVSLFDQMTNTNVNRNIFRLFSQYWTETTYIDESNYDINNRKISDAHFSEMYRNVLYDLQDAKTLANTDTKKGMIETLEVYTWQQLVDTYADIPYSNALLGDVDPTPSYDSDADIYDDLIIRINTAINLLNSSTSGYVQADLIYQGNVTAWIKFANSLKLKIAMRIADYDTLTAKLLSEEAASAGVFSNNNDNANLEYQSTPPNTNPLWVDLVQTGRSDFVAANTIVDYMNTNLDPRRPFYFKENIGAGVFIGGTYGDNNSFSGFTQIGEVMHTPTFRGVLMDFSEIKFLLAEAIERGYAVGGSASNHYTEAITANMEDWGVNASDITTYLGQPSVDYSTATGTWRQKIGFQFWLAMYNRGFEGWCVYRKYDAPVMNIAAESGLPIPNRYTYPLNEQTSNATNYAAAASAIGGDLQQTKVFWDVN